MASYFLPSYFQKRLLRYALSRLDFLETEALELEDLGITWGQRSVVELKNVGIQIKKLAAAVPLPPAIELSRARIRLLRLTIPADLNRSGIVAEVEGVEVHINFRPENGSDEKTSNQPKADTAPSRGSKANRPRISSSAVHDPGGQAIPSSQDLAVSFLQSEPAQEREELQALVQAQSQQLNESIISTASTGDDVGLGAPGGLSLPTFVANFFKGVADRLSIEIKDVSITVDMRLPQDGTDERDSISLIFKMQELVLKGILPQQDATSQRSGKRLIEMNNFEIVLQSEPDLLSPVSATSSPKLSKSRSKLSSTASRSSTADLETFGSIDRDLQRPTAFADATSTRSMDSVSRSVSPEDDSPAFASTTGLGLDNFGYMQRSSAGLDGSIQSSQASQFWRGTARADTGSDHAIDNQTHAEELVRTATLHSPTIGGEVQPTTLSEDLSESRVFTHDEAESMYMSAVSGGFEDDGNSQAMPGAWDWPSSDNHASDLEQQGKMKQILSELPGPSENVAIETPVVTEQRNRIPVVVDSVSEPPQTPYRDYQQPETLSSFVKKRVILVDTILLSLPPSPAEEPLQATLDTLLDQRYPQLVRNDARASVFISQQLPTPFSSQLFQSQAVLPDNNRRPLSAGSAFDFSETEQPNVPEVEIRNASASVDLAIGKVMVRMCQEVLRAQPKSKDKAPDHQTPAVPPVNIRIGAAKLNICERVPSLANTTDHLPRLDRRLESLLLDDCLLQLSLAEVRSVTMQHSTQNFQRVTIRKISLGHTAQQLVYFSEDIRSSISGTQVLQDDFALVVVPDGSTNRLDVRLRPVHIVLDLLQLDEVLSRSGGLSSILELGSSIASTSTVRGGSSQPKSSNVRQRSVRFESPGHPPTTAEKSSTVSGKLDVRLAGLSLDLVGSETNMQVKTSVVKLVYRQNIAGVQVDRAVLIGPVTPGSKGRRDIDINLTNIRFQYLTAPEDNDLDRLITLLTPSNDRYDEEDDIMVDTLLRQRRKGSVLRLTVSELQAVVDGLAWQEPIAKLADELGKLSSVAKYLPDDDRPGILTFLLVKKVGLRLTPDSVFGRLKFDAELFEAAHVNVPSLVAAQASTLSLYRNDGEPLAHEVTAQPEAHSAVAPPMLMCRFIADEMEPKVRLKLSNVCVEYRVSTLIAAMEMIERLKAASQAEDVNKSPPSSPSSSNSEISSSLRRRIGVSVSTRDSAIALSPSVTTAKALMILTDATFANSPSRRTDNTASLDIKRASLMVIDDTAKIESSSDNVDHKLYFDENDQIQQLVKSGFVPVGYISSASAIVRMTQEKSTNGQNLDIEFRNNLFILETCADSTQTLIQILSNLNPPSAPSKSLKYRTEIVPIEDMLASFTGNAYVTSPGADAGLQVSFDESESDEDSEPELDDDDTNFFRTNFEDDEDEMAESYVDSELAQSAMSTSMSVAAVGITESVAQASHESVMMHSLLEFRNDHFANKSTVGGTAHRWNSTQNTYGLGTERSLTESPLKVRIRDVHIIWNLFDGYDWQATRDTISQAVKDIETKAASRRPRSGSRISPQVEDDDESVIGDFLFNSIYIGIPTGKNPGDLANAINHDIDDLASETGSYATSTTVTASPTRRQSFPRTRQKKLRLNRSKQHKMTFELKGVSADMLVFPPNSDEVESSLDIRVRDLEVFDHVPTSTWKKFATYMHDAGEREVDTNMVHLEILNVKPVADLAASEMVLKITILPLRLHVDQDALDFMTRFFEFKDEKAPISSTPSAPPFLQRVEVNPVRLRLDFKPKRVDYGGLRSGRTTEFMNFFVLDRADMVLRRVILYGVSGFDRLGIMLNSIWTPDVKRNQLPGILSSLAPIRPLTDVSSGLKELVVVPMREYKKDGRIVRSIQKGAVAFATTTAKELVNFGAKLAIGTQAALQNAEAVLAPGTAQDDGDSQDEEKKQISLYADQPVGIVQGLRGAYASLERDLLLAKDAIIAVPGEVMASGSATGAAKAVLQASPTIILRPAIGASKAVGQTLRGAGNAMDRKNLRRMEEKYKYGR